MEIGDSKIHSCDNSIRLSPIVKPSENTQIYNIKTELVSIPNKNRNLTVRFS